MCIQVVVKLVLRIGHFHDAFETFIGIDYNSRSCRDQHKSGRTLAPHVDSTKFASW